MDIDKIIADVRFACQLLHQVPPTSLGKGHALYAQLILYDILASSGQEAHAREGLARGERDCYVAAYSGAEIIDLAAYRRRV